MPRIILAAVAAWLVGAPPAVQADPPEAAGGACATVADCRAELHEARQAVAWQKAARHRLEAHLRRLHRPTVIEAAQLAARATGVDAGAMVAVASCETGGTFDPYSRNPSSGALGPWQFLPSTWAHTPFAAWPATDPFAAALAVAGIVRREGWRQWVCQP